MIRSRFGSVSGIDRFHFDLVRRELPLTHGLADTPRSSMPSKASGYRASPSRRATRLRGRGRAAPSCRAPSGRGSAWSGCSRSTPGSSNSHQGTTPSGPDNVRLVGASYTGSSGAGSNSGSSFPQKNAPRQSIPARSALLGARRARRFGKAAPLGLATRRTDSSGVDTPPADGEGTAKKKCSMGLAGTWCGVQDTSAGRPTPFFGPAAHSFQL